MDSVPQKPIPTQAASIEKHDDLKKQDTTVAPQSATDNTHFDQIWDPKDFPMNIPEPILQSMKKEELLRFRFFKENTRVLDYFPLVSTSHKLVEFTNEFAQQYVQIPPSLTSFSSFHF